MRLLALCLLLIPTLGWSIQKVSYEIDDFSCGIVLGDIYGNGITAGKVGKNCLKDAENVYVNKRDSSVIARERGASINTTAVNSNSSATVENIINFIFDGNDVELVVRSSQVIARCDGNSPMTCTNITGVTLNSTTALKHVVALGRIWFIGGGTTPFSVNRAGALAFIPSMPIGTEIGTHRNRLVVTGVSGNESRVYLSGELDGTDWTTGSQSTSPAIISLGGANDSNEITCQMGSHNDVYLFGKAESLWGLYGFDLDDFETRILHPSIGCVAERATVHMTDGSMMWVSRSGFMRMRGNSIEDVSGNIRYLAERISSLGFRYKQGEFRRNYVAIEHKGDYFLAYSTGVSGGSFIDNDNMLVFEADKAWVKFSNIYASSFDYFGGGSLNRDLLHYGNSNGTGFINMFGCIGGVSCSGTTLGSYNSYIQTENIDFGLPEQFKSFETVYVDFYPTPVDIFSAYDDVSMPVTYTIDDFRDAAADVIVTTLTVSGTARMYSMKINLGQSGVGTAPKGKWIRLKFNTNATNNPFFIQRIKIIGTAFDVI